MVTKYWELSAPDSLRGRAEWDGSVDLESLTCPIDPGHQRGGRRITDLGVLLTSKRITDFIWTWHWDCLIHDRVLGLFRDNGFTGFEVKPVVAHMKIRAKKRDWCDDNPGLRLEDVASVEIPKLWEVVVTGWAGIAPPESGVKLIESCPGCGYLEYQGFSDPSRLIDDMQWDGSDFFIVWPYPSFVFVTDRVAKIIRREKLTGAKLRAPETLEVYPPTIPLGRAGPGRLSYCMPEPRARELGEPLGIY